jgi:hypothetical protein
MNSILSDGYSNVFNVEMFRKELTVNVLHDSYLNENKKQHRPTYEKRHTFWDGDGDRLVWKCSIYRPSVAAPS